jgi:hypothetical protein
MMQTKAKEEPDDTMGSGAMGIATTEADGWCTAVAKLWVSTSMFLHVATSIPSTVSFTRSFDRNCGGTVDSMWPQLLLFDCRIKMMNGKHSRKHKKS